MAVINNEWLVDPETGEITGRLDMAKDFHVTDMASAEWVLENLQEAEFETAKLQAMKDERIAAMNAMINTAQKRTDWLLWRFKDELEDFTRKQLEGRKEKHLKTPFGRLEFSNRERRKVVVIDIARAVLWCTRNAKEAVKTVKTILVSELKDRTDLPKNVFEIVEPKEKFEIKTGAQKEPR